MSVYALDRDVTNAPDHRIVVIIIAFLLMTESRVTRIDIEVTGAPCRRLIEVETLDFAAVHDRTRDRDHEPLQGVFVEDKAVTVQVDHAEAKAKAKAEAKAEAEAKAVAAAAAAAVTRPGDVLDDERIHRIREAPVSPPDQVHDQDQDLGIGRAPLDPVVALHYRLV